MNNRTAIIIATVGVILSLALGVTGGAVAGFLAYQYAPRLTNSVARIPSQVVPQFPNQADPGFQQGRPRFRNTGTEGALISDVTPDSPAAAAGLQQGDIITSVGGQALDGTHPLDQLIGQHKPGDTVAIQVNRNGQSQAFNVTLGTNPSKASQPYLGVTFMSLTPSSSPTPGSGN